MIVEWDGNEIDIIEYTKNDKDWLKKYINKFYPDFWENDEISGIDINFRKRGRKLYPMLKYDNDLLYYIDDVPRGAILDVFN